jgi:hypothetical protein
LGDKCREQAEREASPTAAIIDNQSVRKEDQGQKAPTLSSHARAADAGRRSFR